MPETVPLPPSRETEASSPGLSQVARGLLVGEVLLLSQLDGLLAAGHPKILLDARPVVGHGLHGDAQLRGYLPVAVASGRQGQHLVVPGTELGERRGPVPG